MTICHLSDLHFREIGPREEAVRDCVNGLHPDLIFITGDFVEGRPRLTSLTTEKVRKAKSELTPAHLKWLGQLKARLGLWGVLGNKEHMRGRDINHIVRDLESAGVRMLVNQNHRVTGGESGKVRKWESEKGRGEKGEGQVWLVGVDDPHTRHDDLQKAISGIPSGGIKVLLAHSPGIIREAARFGVELVLVGHTHGGQIRLPGLRPLYLNLKCSFKYASGLFRKGKTWLYVNRGIGMSLPLLRAFVVPEIALLTLKRAGDSRQSPKANLAKGGRRASLASLRGRSGPKAGGQGTGYRKKLNPNP